MTKPSGFFQWFDGVTDSVAKTPVGQLMASQGYKVAHTGGGCLAWDKSVGDFHLWICDEGNGLGDTLDELYLVGCHDKDGNFIAENSTEGLAAAVAWCDQESVLIQLAEADGAILHWQLPKPAVDALIASGRAKMDGNDLLVHHLAIANDDGSYSMPEPCRQHRDNGRGICCDCGAVL